MKLSDKNVAALLLEVNQDIEEYAETTVKNVIEDKDFDFLFYPPNCGLTDPEKAALSRLVNDEDLKNALRKIIADNTAGVIFNMLNLFDGTTTPKNDGDWTGIKLVDEDQDDSSSPFEDTLHDSFLETYWKWKEIRGNKGWKLDSHD